MDGRAFHNLLPFFLLSLFCSIDVVDVCAFRDLITFQTTRYTRNEFNNKTFYWSLFRSFSKLFRRTRTRIFMLIEKLNRIIHHRWNFSPHRCLYWSDKEKLCAHSFMSRRIVVQLFINAYFHAADTHVTQLICMANAPQHSMTNDDNNNGKPKSKKNAIMIIVPI